VLRKRRFFTIHVESLQKLVQQTIDGEGSAWQELQLAIEPTISKLVRRHNDLRRRCLADSADVVADIRTATLERLARHDFRNLREFVERSQLGGERAPESFHAWLYGCVDYAIREYLRQIYGRGSQETELVGQALPSKQALHAQTEAFDDNERGMLATLSLTTRMTVAEISDYIAKSFASDEVEAVRLYFVENLSYGEIAQRLALKDAGAAEQLIRRLKARLQHRFQLRDTDSEKAK